MTGWPWQCTRPMVTCSGLWHSGMYHWFNIIMGCSGSGSLGDNILMYVYQHINCYYQMHTYIPQTTIHKYTFIKLFYCILLANIFTFFF